MTARGSQARRRSLGLATAIKMPMRTIMMEEERTTERASESASRGSSRARADIESVTAVEEASPPTSPVSPSPRWGPRNRMAAYPRKLIPAIRTTSVPICRGLSASKGPNVLPRTDHVAGEGQRAEEEADQEGRLRGEPALRSATHVVEEVHDQEEDERSEGGDDHRPPVLSRHQHRETGNQRHQRMRARAPEER